MIDYLNSTVMSVTTSFWSTVNTNPLSKSPLENGSDGELYMPRGIEIHWIYQSKQMAIAR
jgi:hypothetical protein